MNLLQQRLIITAIRNWTDILYCASRSWKTIVFVGARSHKMDSTDYFTLAPEKDEIFAGQVTSNTTKQSAKLFVGIMVLI